MARLMPFTTTMGSTPRCGISGSIPENLVTCFFTLRVTLRATFRAPAAVSLGFARLARDLTADGLPRDLAAVDLAPAFLGFARDLTAAGLARRETAPAFARRVTAARRVAAAPALRRAPALRAGLVAFLAVDRRVDFFFDTGIWSSHLDIGDNLLKRRIGALSSLDLPCVTSRVIRSTCIYWRDQVFIPHQ